MSDYNDGLLPEPCLRLDFGFGQQYASIELGDGSGYVRVAENAKLRELANDMVNCFKLGARSGEGISRQWCRELFDSYSSKLDKIGIEVGNELQPDHHDERG